MHFSKDDILKIANLSKLRFSEKELESYTDELNTILEYIDILNEVNTENIDPLIFINNEDQKLREDQVKKSLEISDVIINVKDSADGAVVVPKFVNAE